jgi:hypothetical protein
MHDCVPLAIQYSIGVVHGLKEISHDIKMFGPERDHHSDTDWQEVIAGKDYLKDKHWWIILPNSVGKRGTYVRMYDWNSTLTSTLPDWQFNTKFGPTDTCRPACVCVSVRANVPHVT